MDNYYRSSEQAPYHLSVGAVIINDQHQVLCHYFKSLTYAGQTLNDFYILMRETVERNETLEQAIQRGCMEEMGAGVEIIDFLGPIVSHHHDRGFLAEKTTLYFKCKLISQDDDLRAADDPEKDSQIVWRDIDELIARMSTQSKGLDRTDLDESAILKRLR